MHKVQVRGDLETLHQAGFPFSDRMVITGTERRLIVQRASGPRYRRGDVIGEIARQDIDAMWWPFVGGGVNRTLAIRLQSGHSACIKVRTQPGEHLADNPG